MEITPDTAAVHEDGIRGKTNAGVALLAVLGLTVLVLGLAGATFGLFNLRIQRARVEADSAVTKQLADDTLRLSSAGLASLVILAPREAPKNSFFFLGGDRNGDRMQSRSGPIKPTPTGDYRRTLLDREGNEIFGPHKNEDPNAVPTYQHFDEDVGLDGLPDELENLYHPALRPDPEGDNYHPLFNPEGTEGNGIKDLISGGGGEIDVNGNEIFEMEEHAGERWLRTPGVLKGLVQSGRNVANGVWSVHASDVNNGLDINGPELVTSRLLNALFRLTDLKEATVNSPAEVLGHNQRGFEALDQLDFFLGTSAIRLKDFFGNPIPIQNQDPHAVKIIKARRSLPGGKFSSLDQFLDIVGPRHLGILTLPSQEDQNDPNDPNDNGVSDLDEFERLKPLLSVHSKQTKTYIRAGRKPGDVGTELRAPLPLNTVSSEVLAATVLAAFDPLVIPSGNPSSIPFDTAARFFARTVINFRMGVPFVARPSGRNRSRPGPLRNQEDLEQFMSDFRNLLRNDTSRPQRNDVLLRNFDNTIIQFSENQVYQNQIPDRVQDSPVDKSSLRLSLSSLPVTYFPTGTFMVEAESRIHLGQRSIPDWLFHDEQFVRVGGSQGGFAPRNMFLGEGEDRTVRRFMAVIKVADMLHHFTQSDFEGKDGKQGQHVHTRSYPERIMDPDQAGVPIVGDGTRFTVPGGITDIVFDRQRGIAYFIDNITDNLYAVLYGRGDLQPKPIAQLPFPYERGSTNNFIEIDPRSVFGDMGRLYIGRKKRNQILVYDLNGSVPAGEPVPLRRPSIDLEGAPTTDITGGIGTPAPLLGLVPFPAGQGFFIAAERNNQSIVRFVYPRVDARARPEEDDPSTPEDDRFDGEDDDLDGVVDDRPTHPSGRPEGNVRDLVDNDGDGMADDSAAGGLTAPVPLLPPESFPLGVFPTAWAFDPILNQFIVTSGYHLTRLRSVGLEAATPSGMAADSIRRVITQFLTPTERVVRLAVHPGTSIYCLTRDTATQKSKLLKFQAEKIVIQDIFRLPVNGEGLEFDPINRLIFVTGKGPGSEPNRLVVVRDRGSMLEQVLVKPGVQYNRSEILADPQRGLILTASRTTGHILLAPFRSFPHSEKNKNLDNGGQIKLAPVSSQDSPLRERQFMLKADFDNDIHLRRPSLTNTRVDANPATPTQRVQGQIIRVTGRDEQVDIPDSVFSTTNDPPRLLPDGFFSFTNTRSNEPAVEAIRYKARDIYGSGAIISNSPHRGLRTGGVSFWIKFDGLGTLPGGDLAIDPTSPPNTVDLFRMFFKARIDPYVFLQMEDDKTVEEELERVMGLQPGTVDRGSIRFRPPLPRYYVESRISLRQFKDTNGNGDIDTVRVRCTNHMDLAFGSLGVSYRRADNPAVIVNDIFDPISQNLDISYLPSRPDNLLGFREKPPRRVHLADGGEWVHFATLWGSGLEASSGKEKVHARFYLNGKRMPHEGLNIPIDPAAHPERDDPLTAATEPTDGVDSDRDGAVDDLGGIYGEPEPDHTRRNLVDDDGDGVVDDGYTFSPPFVMIGAVLNDSTPPAMNMRVIVDDLVFFPNENAFIPPDPNRIDPVDNFIPRRFLSRGETPDFDFDGSSDEGEPFNDINGNGKYDQVARSFFDRNGNGVHDQGEPYQGMYPYDFGDSVPGEPYYDHDGDGNWGGTDSDLDLGHDFESSGSLGSEIGIGIGGFSSDYYEDRNGNAIRDDGEFYWDLNSNTSPGRDPPEPFNDNNFSGTLDGGGKFIREFDQTLNPGDRVAWLAFDGVIPEGTNLNPELVLKSLSGRTLNHFYGDRKARNARRVGFTIQEPSTLEYRINFMVPRDGGIYEPFRAGDGVAGTRAEGDDIQIVPVGDIVKNGDRIVGPGINGLIDSTPAGGDRFVMPFQSPILESVTVAVIIKPQILFLEENIINVPDVAQVQ